MKELSLNILDIAENSINACATLIEILINETDNILTVTVKDNGCGMEPEVLKRAEDPFFTTRTTRKVGMGIPLFKLAAEQTGGCLKTVSKSLKKSAEHHGTEITATFYKDHLDFKPLGDVGSTITSIITGHPEIDICFIHKTNSGKIILDTRAIRKQLKGVPLDTYDVLKWIKEYLDEQYKLLYIQTNQKIFSEGKIPNEIFG